MAGYGGQQFARVEVGILGAAQRGDQGGPCLLVLSA
jgi:hypothetical protein